MGILAFAFLTLSAPCTPSMQLTNHSALPAYVCAKLYSKVIKASFVDENEGPAPDHIEPFLAVPGGGA